MTNKTTKICCTLALLASVAATPAFSQAKNFSGTNLAIKGSLNGAESGFLDTDGIDSARFKFGDVSSNVGVDLSHGFEINDKFVLGLGVTADFGKTKIGGASASLFDGEDTTTASASGNIKDNKSIYIQPTYIVSSNSAVFAKLGYNEAKVSFTDLNAISGSKTTNGLTYGLGLKTFLNPAVFLQVEGLITEYDKEVLAENYEVSGSDISVEPKVYSAVISIGYKF
jgi:opacity protein-like surface antigen